VQKILQYISGLEVDEVRAALWGREIGEGFDMRYLRWLRPLVVVASLVLGASGCHDSAEQSTGSGGQAAGTSTFEYATPPAVADSTATCIPTLPSITNTQVIDKPRFGSQPAVHMAVLSGGNAKCLQYGPSFWIGVESGPDYEFAHQGALLLLAPIAVDNKGGWKANVPYDSSSPAVVFVEGGNRCKVFMNQVDSVNGVFTLSGDDWPKPNGCMLAGRSLIKH